MTPLILITIILTLATLTLVNLASFRYNNTVYIKSEVDNNYYLVKNEKNKLEVANGLANLNLRITKLLTLAEGSEGSRFASNIKNTIKNYRGPSSLIENTSSFTINKGEQISFCMTKKSDKKVYDINLLTFVSIHELAHLGSNSVGHTKEFRDFFKFLLEKAVKYSIYEYTDYSKNPQNYCGVIIKTSPIS